MPSNPAKKKAKRAKKPRAAKAIKGYMSQFDAKTRMAMIALDGETLSCDGSGVLYACNTLVKIVPL